MIPGPFDVRNPDPKAPEAKTVAASAKASAERASHDAASSRDQDGDGRAIPGPAPAFGDVVEQGRIVPERGPRPGPPHSGEGARVMARTTAARAASATLNAEPAPIVPASSAPALSAGSRAEPTARNDIDPVPEGEERGLLVPVIAKPERPGPRGDGDPQTTAPRDPRAESEGAQAVSPAVQEDRPLPEVPFGFTDGQRTEADRAERPSLAGDLAGRTGDEAPGDRDAVSPSPMADAVSTATGVLQAPAREQAGERAAQLRDAAPAHADIPSPPSRSASPDRNEARASAPRDESPASRTGRADPYSIAATMNEPVSSAEAAQALAAATPQAPAPATSTQATPATPAPPAAMAIPAMPPETSSNPIPEGMTGDELPMGAAMRGEASADIRRSASPLRPSTLSGADAVQEIVRAAVVTKGPTTIELRLDPSELGKIDIELSFADDRVSIVVRGEREDALDLMRRSSDDLGRMLRQAGLDLGSLSFSREQAGERGREQALRAFAVEGAGEGVEDGPVRSVLNLDPARDRVDIRI